MSTPAKTSIQVKRFIQVPRERAFAAWTTPEQIQRWFGPRHCRVVDAAIDLRVGGAYHLRAVSEQMGAVVVRGQYREIAEAAKLAFTWGFDDDPDWAGVVSVVTVEFIAQEGGTEIQITHEGFPSEESAENHTEGWEGSLDKLEIRTATIMEMNGPGQFSWNELLTTDVDKASAFYAQLFGWQPATMPGGMPYTLFRQGTWEVGGMMQHPMPGAPAQWLAYVTVKNADAAAARITELGGAICKAPFDIPNVGRIAIATDPQGAVFGIFQPGC